MDFDKAVSLGMLFLLDDAEDDLTILGDDATEDSECEENVPKRKRVHTCWVQDFIRRRQQAEHNTQYSLFLELEMRDNLKEMSRMLRMDPVCFYSLVAELYPRLKKEDTHWRKSIEPAFRLCVALKFYSSGLNFIDLSHAFRIGEKTARTIVYETSDAIWDVLSDEYMKCPSTRQEWLDVAEGFGERWNFPQCLGALDGKHVGVVPPPRSGSLFHNYKGGFSIILLALCNANYEFMYVDCGSEGRVGDAAIWNRCDLKAALEDNQLGKPIQGKLPGSEQMAPFVVVGDDAFAMSPYLLKPYTNSDMALPEHVFNTRLSRARRVSENVFGILVNRFRCLKKPLHMLPKNATKVTLACCVLHNFLRQEIGAKYIHPVANVGEWNLEDSLTSLKGLQKNKSNNPSCLAKTARDVYRDYFMSPAGALDWQWEKVQIKVNLNLQKH